MSLEAVSSFALIVTLLVISPGPNGALIFKTVPFQGELNGVANVVGVLTAFYLHGVFSIFGLSAIIVGSARAFLFVKTLGAFYLAYLGIKALWTAIKRHKTIRTDLDIDAQPRQSLRSSYFEGFITNLLNPKVRVFYLAAFPQFVGFDVGLNSTVIISAFGLVSIHAVVNFMWFTGMVFIVGRTTSWAKSGWLSRVVKGVTGAVLLWFGYKLVTTRATPS